MPKQQKILIVEDERPIALALKLKLEHEGFSATTAFDGEAGIEMLKNNKFDLVLLDLVMPKLDGFGVLNEMQKLKDKTPVIVSSNLSQEEDAKRARELGVKDYFIKSNTPLSEVIAHIKKVLK